jgi:hypothetical protein
MPLPRKAGRERSDCCGEHEVVSPPRLTLFEILSEAEGAEDRGSDSEDKEGENLRPENVDSVSF